MQSLKHFFAQLPLDSPQIRVRGVGVQERMRPGLIDRPQGTGDHLFMFFYDPVILRPGGKEARHPPETLIVWRPGQAQYYGNPEQSYTHSWIHCDGTAVRRLLKQNRVPSDTPLSLPDPSLVEKALLDIYAELTAHAQPDTVIVQNLLENWVREIARRGRDEGKEAQVPRRLLELKHHIEMYYREPMALDELAERVHLSVPHLCSEFKKHFRTPVIDYVIRLRLHEAAYLLRDRNLSISEIALRVGYEDIYYFSKLFKKHYGVSPRAMRKELGRGA